MPWSQTSPMDQRIQCIADYLRESLSITDLCALYGVSRKRYKLGTLVTLYTGNMGDTATMADLREVGHALAGDITHGRT